MIVRRSRCAGAQQNRSRSPRLLRAEPLEARALLAAISPLANPFLLASAAGGGAGVYAQAYTTPPPSVAKAAAAAVNTAGVVNGTSTMLSVLGSTAQGASSLVYDWTLTSGPTGGTAKFSANNSNAAQNDTVTFNEAGVYTFTATIIGPNNASTTSSVKVSVAQTLSGISLYAGGSKTPVNTGTSLNVTSPTLTLTAVAVDQFGNALAVQPTFNFSPPTYPAGHMPSFTTCGNTRITTFTEAGSYGVSVYTTAGGASAGTAVEINVVAEPTYVNISQLGGSGVIGGTSVQYTVSPFLDQFHNPISTSTTVKWTAASVPGGAAAPQFSTSGSTSTVKFSAAGGYLLTATVTDSSHDTIAETFVALVGQVPSGAKSASPITTSGTSQLLPTPVLVDQFGNALLGSAALTWTTTTVPSGAPAPTFASSGAGTTVTFDMAGTYVFQAKASGGTATFSVTVTVGQTLKSIVVTPGTASLQGAGTQQFSAEALDQFQRAMANQPAFTWIAAGGTISSKGLFTAPNVSGTYTVVAQSGSLSGSAKVTVTSATPSPSPPPSPAIGGIQDPALAALVAKLDAAGSLNRADMIQILTSVGASGTVSATDFADLKTILADASQYKMPGYVEQLAADVVDGSVANAHYQGATLGNLAAGSSAAQLNKLIDKWFYGTDLPTLTSSGITYEAASGSLFPVTPSHNDEFQGELGDCYLISSLGTIADSNPQAVENMFINNGDGTFTVRFYSGSTPSYVTVNLSLPTYEGAFIYADCGCSITSTTNSLWIPLAEKAYAQWNETGLEGGTGQNSYSAIQGGWMSTVDAQVLGHNASSYSLTSTTQQAMISAIESGEAVTIGTDSSSNNADTLPYGLYGAHAYAVIGYNTSTGVFTLYNPWGCDQPGGLTWSDLESTCDGFVTATTAGSTPIDSPRPQAAGASPISAAAADAVLASQDWRLVA